MGFLSSVWDAIKGAVRVIGRVIATVCLCGYIRPLIRLSYLAAEKTAPPVFILSDDKGPLIDPAALQPSIDFVTKTYKDRFMSR
jgi:hypothetical protein